MNHATFPISRAAAVVMIGLLAASADAFMVSNGATTLFKDNFEGETVGQWAPAVATSTPNPQVGTWTNIQATSGTVNVTNAAAVPGGTSSTYRPGAFQGSKYLQLTRNSGDPDRATAVLTSAQNTGTLRLTTMIAIAPAGIAAGHYVMLSVDTNTTDYTTGQTGDQVFSSDGLLSIDFRGDNGNGFGNISWKSFGSSYNDVNTSTGVMTYKIGTWLELDLDVVFGTGGAADKFQLTLINPTTGISTQSLLTTFDGSGVASSATPVTATGGKAVTRIYAADFAASHTFFLDAVVPEPASLALLGLGGLMLLRRKKN